MTAAATLIELHSLPSIDFFLAIFGTDELILEAKEHYAKRSYRNRYHIAGPNGLQRLSIPLQRGKNQQLDIKTVRIAYEENWQINHWRSLTAAYNKSPFFMHYEDELKVFFTEKEEFLYDWNQKLLNWCLEQVGLEVKISETQFYQKTEVDSLANLSNQLLPSSEPSKGASLMNYPQVFQEKNGFLPNLSILDLLCCQGPNSWFILQEAAQQNSTT